MNAINPTPPPQPPPRPPGPSTPPPPPGPKRGASLRLSAPAPCRHCTRPTYGADTLGPVHPCCQAWMEMGWPGFCPACAESRKAARRDLAGVR